MISRGRRLIALAAAAVLVGSVAGACNMNAEQPTPIIVIVTPSPTPEVTPSPTPEITETPAASESASPSPSVPPSATPVPGEGLVGVEYCTGSSTIKAFFTEVANKVSWAVYCGRMPSGWGVKPPNGLNYGLPSSGSWMTGEYLKSGGAAITIKEGHYGADICASNTGSLGTANFASMTGNFYTISGGFAICINPGTKSAYEISGTNVTQATFLSIASNLVLVPKT